MENNVLEHHGIKGQKWGVRRFQNPDGTLTEAGKRRLNTEPSKGKERKGLTDKQKTAIKVGAAAVGTALAAYGAYKLGKSGKIESFARRGKDTVDKIMESAKKARPPVTDVSSMSDAELKAKVQRMALEQQYRKMSPAKVSKGKRTVDKVLKTAGTIAGVTSTGLTIYNNAKRIQKIIEDETKAKRNSERRE